MVKRPLKNFVLHSHTPVDWKVAGALESGDWFTSIPRSDSEERVVSPASVELFGQNSNHVVVIFTQIDHASWWKSTLRFSVEV